MDTIRTYLDNMFVALPKNNEMSKLKNDLLTNMEDKYHELKSQGKTENEAIGIVISEFGNIDELVKELNINVQSENQLILPKVDNTVFLDFLDAKKSSALTTAFAVMLCILAPAALIFSVFITSYSTLGVAIGMFFLITLVAVAVGMFVFSGDKMKHYEYLKQPFEMSLQTKSNIQSEQDSFMAKKTTMTIISLILLVLSPLTVIIPAITVTNENLIVLCVVWLLVLVSIGVFILVYSSTIQEGYNILLKKEDYAPKTVSTKKLSIFSQLWWSLAVCIYLLWSFLTSAWHITWIIWPIAGVLFGGISEIFKATSQDEVI